MAVVTGTNGASATPATDLYNIIDTALQGNGGWTQAGITVTVSAANASTTADCKVWKCTGGVKDHYVCFEIDDTNARIRVRVAENWEDGGAAANKIRRGTGGGTLATHGDNQSVTPTANDTVSDADIAWGSTSPNNTYAQVNTSAGGYGYLYKVETSRLTFGTRSSSNNYFAIAGEYSSLITAITDSAPVFLARHAYNSTPVTLGTGSSGSVSFTRAPGVGATALTGAFWGGIMPLHFPVYASSPTAGGDAQGPHAASVSSRYHSNTTFMSQAVIHGSQTGAIQARAQFRGYLPDFIAGTSNAAGAPEPPILDTIVVNGSTYYWLGASYNISSAFGASEALLAVKA